MRFDILTLFPGLFDGFLRESLLSKGIERKLLEIHLWNFREWATDRHQSVDDRPYGGGPGMLISCEPVFRCLDSVNAASETPGQLILLTPAGERLTQTLVEELATHQRLILLCGRYEGFDQRISEGTQAREISVGDFVCNGGEVPAMLMIETIMRLIPGLLGDERSAREDSFACEGGLEYPQYTRPQEFRGMKVPDILLSGDHGRIAAWREMMARQKTEQRQAKNSLPE
ncbi:MAG: tRNA (guanosine(37)-N1)-methyltransferase TrmD [Planctomycetaceae bacterium]|nr:tRNA (guanosine(37)-N1)-methyltransferase TrmD [Planctomycetaceae bacterium]